MDPLNVSVLSSLPPVDESGVDALLAAEIARDPHKLVVLDDDPAGVQTVHDVSVYTDWSADSDAAFSAEVDRCVRAEEEIIRPGKTAVCYTRRKLLALESDTKESALLRSVKISDGVQSLVARLSVAPAFVIAKGGITSSDVGIKALPEDWKCPRCKQPKEKFNKA